MLAQSVVMAAQKQNLEVIILGESELSEKKFGALLAVAAGSNSKPRLVVLDHHPKQAAKTIVLVGKGITFDSGGINLKPSSGMEEMKSDMAGAAAVAGTLLALSKINPSIRVVGVMPMVENMPSGTATRPGDVITTYSGKTVEINNTDAEGRLILADALAWAKDTYQPDVMVDLATLTGACVVALGEQIAGLFTEDEELRSQLLASAKINYERLWALPMPEDYDKLLKSEIADTSNCGKDRWGGALTAALFLAKFTEKTPWAHLDIAGPAFAKKAGPYCPAGGTGFGVRLLCDWICGLG
jgi:leucyl aminopeptidase